MSNSFPNKCLVDTNVPINANRATKHDPIPDELNTCVYKCVETIKHVVKNKNNLVIDSGDEIYDEYRRNLSMSGQPGVGDLFIKWVHDNRHNFPESNRVLITKNTDNTYNEFPDSENLTNFDIDDRKFIAVANAHPNKPPILQATDSKWWGYKDALQDVGITVNFLCPEYAKAKYEEKK